MMLLAQVDWRDQANTLTDSTWAWGTSASAAAC